MTAPTEQAPSAETPDTPAKPTLEESLAALDEETRTYVLGEITTARTEARKLRDRVKAAEPKATAYDRLEAASRTAEETAQEAIKSAEAKAVAANHRIAKAEIKAALTGVVTNPAKYVERLNLALYVDEDGEIDTDAVEQLKADELAERESAGRPRPPRPDASQASGANGRSKADPAQEFASLMQAQLRGV